MKNINHTRVILFSAAWLLLSSCGGMLSSDKPAEKTFWLNPFSPAASAESGPGQTGLTVQFSVVPGLDSDHLLILDPNSELNHFAGARWPDYLPEFAGSLIRRSLQETGWFTKVSDGRTSGLDDCELQLEAQKFYTLTNAAGKPESVQMSMSGDYRCHGAASQLRLDSSVRVNGADLAAIVAAHQLALDQLLGSLLTQLKHSRDAVESG